MASNKAHHVTGWAAGLMAAAVVAHSGAGGDYHLGTLMTLCMGVCGGTAPDWMEVAWWTRKRRLWIAHRTLTHWGVGWLALLYWSYHALGEHVMAVPAFGFAAGGLMHLLADWPNPLGVPWIATRHSLKLWNSGRCDIIIVALAWLAAFIVGDHVWFDDIHTLHAINFVKALPIHAWLIRAGYPAFS
jgi:hypothetical protein